MANTVRIKRRVSGAPGAPAALKTGELAWNMADNTLYGGYGDDGSGNSTSVKPLGGEGVFAKTVDVAADIAAAVASAGYGDMAKATYDSNNDGKVDLAEVADSANSVEWANVANAPVSFPPSAHNHPISDITGLQSSLDGKANANNAALTGVPTAPTAAPGVSTTQIATTAFVEQAIVAFGPGDMLKSVYDANNDGKVDRAALADAVPWTGVTGVPTAFTPEAHAHAMADITGLGAALNLKAPLDSPALTGAPTAPTAVSGTNTTQLATTAFVSAAINALINGAPAALDTLNELAAAMANNANFATTVTNALATKLAIAANLSDLVDIPTARNNLGLGSMALQAASSVSITGGSIDGVVVDGGTF